MKTDTELQKDVMAELSWEPSLDAALIGVEVSQGVVTLSGHVSSYAEKWAAERVAQRVNGVTALTVEIDVKLPGTQTRSDVDIARAAENILRWTSNLPIDKVKAMVEGGWVTLSGEVEWGYQRDAAARSVRYLMGATGVSNDILICPKTASNRVKADIEAALLRRAHDHIGQIVIEVEGGDVKLSGTVKNWAERKLVHNSAWGTPGVRTVVDNLTVAG
jgi:osmotically-inducible protein OsmY